MDGIKDHHSLRAAIRAFFDKTLYRFCSANVNVWSGISDIGFDATPRVGVVYAMDAKKSHPIIGELQDTF